MISSLLGDALAVDGRDQVVGAQPRAFAGRAARHILHERARAVDASFSDRCRSGSTSVSATPMIAARHAAVRLQLRQNALALR